MTASTLSKAPGGIAGCRRRLDHVDARAFLGADFEVADDAVIQRKQLWKADHKAEILPPVRVA